MTGQNKMKDQTQSRALEGLPVKFVSAMRTLFDVLDDNKSGSVSLADIEHWWRKDREEQGGTAIPNGVIESLRSVGQLFPFPADTFYSRKVATSDNMLTFERFCAGLKICLLRNHADLKSDKESNNVSQIFLYFY